MGQTRILKSITFIILIVICQSCNPKKDQKTFQTKDSTVTTLAGQSDSIILKNQLIKIYKWYQENESINHVYFLTKSYGMDTVKLDSVVNEMGKTDFFTEAFLSNYREIGRTTNEMLKRDSTLTMVGLAFPFQEFDTWDGGQGWELDWNTLTINNLSILADSATLKWKCSKPVETKPMEAKFKKENDMWKLSDLEYLHL